MSGGHEVPTDEKATAAAAAVAATLVADPTAGYVTEGMDLNVKSEKDSQSVNAFWFLTFVLFFSFSLLTLPF